MWKAAEESWGEEKLADFQLLFKYTNMDLVYECKKKTSWAK